LLRQFHPSSRHNASRVNARVNLRRNNFDPLLIFFPMLTTYRVLSSVGSVTQRINDRPPHPAAGRLHLDILWWTAGAETSERGIYRRAFRARSSRLPSLPQVSRSYALLPPMPQLAHSGCPQSRTSPKAPPQVLSFPTPASLAPAYF